MATYNGITLTPTVNVLSGGIQIGGTVPYGTQPAIIQAVTTYYYRILATGVRGSTTTLSGIPVGSVIEGTSTT